SLIDVAALLEQTDLIVTGDTGPMHLAHAVGTPIVAIFGPSDPRRYAPRGAHDRVVRIDLPCAPCNRIRRPPARCTHGTPDCLSGVAVAAVTAAIDDVLSGGGSRRDQVSTVAGPEPWRSRTAAEHAPCHCRRTWTVRPKNARSRARANGSRGCARFPS